MSTKMLCRRFSSDSKIQVDLAGKPNCECICIKGFLAWKGHQLIRTKNATRETGLVVQHFCVHLYVFHIKGATPVMMRMMVDVLARQCKFTGPEN